MAWTEEKGTCMRGQGMPMAVLAHSVLVRCVWAEQKGEETAGAEMNDSATMESEKGQDVIKKVAELCAERHAHRKQRRGKAPLSVRYMADTRLDVPNRPPPPSTCAALHPTFPHPNAPSPPFPLRRSPYGLDCRHPPKRMPRRPPWPVTTCSEKLRPRPAPSPLSSRP